MQISAYFKYIQTLRLSPLERVHMYQRFLNKMSRVITRKRRITYAKYTSVTLGCSAFIILVTGYVTRSWSLYQLATENGMYMAYEKTPWSYAEAMTLGTILHAQGDIILSKDGQKVNANEIANGEKIILQEGASLEFLINQSTKATINWPAAFELQDLGQTSNMHDIAINLLYGDYLEVHTQQPEATTNEADDQRVASLPDNIIIKTKNFEVKRLRSSDKLNLVIKKGKEDGHTIQNNGGELVVEKFIQDKKVFTSVKTEQLVAIGEDVTLVEDQAKLISQAITDQNITTSYSIEDQSPKTLSSDVATATASDTPADVVLLSSSKQVISEDQTARLDTLLSPSQLMFSVEAIVVAYLNGTPANGQPSANALAMRIKSVYDTLWISLDSQVISYYNKNNLSLKELTLSTDQLIAKIESNYYVWPTYTKRLKGILAWLLFLETATPVSGDTQTAADGTTGATTPLTFDQLIEQYNLERFQGYLLLK